MADQKISQLTALTATASGDELVIVDTSTGVTKRITLQDLLQGIPVNVGIGTASPAADLHVAGDARIGGVGNSSMRLTYSGGLSIIQPDNGAGATGTFQISPLFSATPYLRVSSGGDVSIPNGALTVQEHATRSYSTTLTNESSEQVSLADFGQSDGENFVNPLIYISVTSGTNDAWGLFNGTSFSLQNIAIGSDIDNGGTANNDTAGKVNVWVDSSDLINIKNRFGSTLTIKLVKVVS